VVVVHRLPAGAPRPAAVRRRVSPPPPPARAGAGTAAPRRSAARRAGGAAKARGLEAGTRKAGAPAGLGLVGAKAAWAPAKGDLASKSGNNPLLGRALTGRVRATFVGGRQVFGA